MLVRSEVIKREHSSGTLKHPRPEVKRLRSNDENIKRMCSSGALKKTHPEVKYLRGNDPTPLLFVAPVHRTARGAVFVMEEGLWILDYRLGRSHRSMVALNI